MCLRSYGKYGNGSKNMTPALLSNHPPSLLGKFDGVNQLFYMPISLSYLIIYHLCLVASSGYGVS